MSFLGLECNISINVPYFYLRQLLYAVTAFHAWKTSFSARAKTKILTPVNLGQRMNEFNGVFVLINKKEEEFETRTRDALLLGRVRILQ